jgi:hypothetical protein
MYKNYFGESKSLTSAFFEFYFAWFLFPAVFALPLIVYQYGSGRFDSLWSCVYALFICFLVTHVIKKWKQKEKQISYVWGLVRPDSESSLHLKPDHSGVSYFSWTRGTDAKKE